MEVRPDFFQAAVVPMLLYGCNAWTLTKRMEKKLDGNYIKMLRAIFNKSWRQHLTKQQLYGHLQPITKTTKVRRTRHVGHCWRSWDKLISDVLLRCSLRVDEQRLYDQLEPIYKSSVLIQDVAWRICRGRWTIETGGKRGSRKSMLAARHDDADDDILKYGNLTKGY